jgi:uncharacterized protein YrrD
MLKRIELREGVGVFTSDDQHVGKLNRFVLDPATNEVTHIVVQKSGLAADEKVVPLRMVDSANGEKVVLARDIGDFDQLPPFEEKHFVRTMDEDIRQEEYSKDESFPAYYWYPPEGYIGYPAYGLEYYAWPPVETRRNIPEQAVPLKEGSNVMSSDGEHVGDVERLFVESGSNRATHFVVAHGMFFKERKLVPVQWVDFVEEDKVQLLVSSQLLERLPAHES